MRTPPDPEQMLDLRLEKKETIAEGVVRLMLRRPDGGLIPAWEPGAHVDLVLTDSLVRQYSLCGDPKDLTNLQVAVLYEQGGRGGSRYIHDNLAEGEQVTVQGPRNHFPLVEAEQYLFIAGGIGITPILPMIAKAEASGADWRLVYGGRSRSSMAYRMELAERFPARVTVHPQDEVGLLDLQSLLARPDEMTSPPAVYCCGPEPLLSAVEARCADWPTGALHIERFAPKPGATDGPTEAFEVQLAQSGTTHTVGPGESILDVLEDQGVEVFSSCREGVCGICETKVLAGIPEHRDSMLTEAEKAALDTMMICVSRSRSPRLVLDL